ncbi:Solute carrier 26 [Phlyctochytrium planicorne]|nr:Solute carrier 26 [Phlyctochytrium planicorne]
MEHCMSLGADFAKIPEIHGRCAFEVACFKGYIAAVEIFIPAVTARSDGRDLMNRGLREAIKGCKASVMLRLIKVGKAFLNLNVEEDFKLAWSSVGIPGIKAMIENSGDKKMKSYGPFISYICDVNTNDAATVLVAIAKFLEGSLGELDEKDLRGVSPAYFISRLLCQRKDPTPLSTLDSLVSRGLNLDMVDRKSGMGALHYAAQQNALMPLKMMLTLGADPNLFSYRKLQDDTLPAVASSEDNADTFSFLTDDSSDIRSHIYKISTGFEFFEVDFFTPMHVATDPEIIEALLYFDADSNICTTRYKFTRLHMLAFQEDLPNRLLIADILTSPDAGEHWRTSQDRFGNTPLHLLMRKLNTTNKEIATLLLGRGINWLILNKNGFPADSDPKTSEEARNFLKSLVEKDFQEQVDNRIVDSADGATTATWFPQPLTMMAARVLRKQKYLLSDFEHRISDLVCGYHVRKTNGSFIPPENLGEFNLSILEPAKTAAPMISMEKWRNAQFLSDQLTTENLDRGGRLKLVNNALKGEYLSQSLFRQNIPGAKVNVPKMNKNNLTPPNNSSSPFGRPPSPNRNAARQQAKKEKRNRDGKVVAVSSSASKASSNAESKGNEESSSSSVSKTFDFTFSLTPPTTDTPDNGSGNTGDPHPSDPRLHRFDSGGSQPVDDIWGDVDGGMEEDVDGEGAWVRGEGEHPPSMVFDSNLDMQSHCLLTLPISEPPLSKADLKRMMWTRIRYYVPVIGWLPSYNLKENLQADVIAGITVACLLIPQGLSYAQALVKIPPVYGLYTCLVPLMVYALLGTSRQLAVGPEALVSILVGAAIKEKSGLKLAHPPEADPTTPGEGGDAFFGATDNVAENIAIANLMCLMVGIFTSILGFFRLGFLDSVLSRALLRGFVTAVAFVVVIDLSSGVLGLPPIPAEVEAHMSPIERAMHTIQHLGEMHLPTAIISFVSIAFLVGAKVVKSNWKNVKGLQLIPEILVLVVMSTILCWAFRWDNYGVAILKDVQGGLIAPSLPNVTMAKLRYYLISAILISVIGFVESIVVAKTYATKHNYGVSPNRELVALGAANTIGSFFGAWPAFGSLGRSAVNDSTGAKTQVAGFVTGLIILVAIVALLPLFYFLPKAVCGAIIVVAAVKLIEMHDVEFILKLRAWKDLGLLLMTFLSTLLISIEVGTLISIGTSLVLVIKHTTKTRIAVLGRALVVDPKSGEVKTKFRSITESNQVQPIEGALVIRIEEGLFFGNTGQLKDRLKRVEMYGELGVHPGEMPRRGRTVGVRNERFGEDEGGEEEAKLEDMGEDSGIKGVVFDISSVQEVDASATQTLLEIVESYHSRNILVCFVKLRDSCKPHFMRSGLWALVGMDHFFDKIRDALDFLKDRGGVDPSPSVASGFTNRDRFDGGGTGGATAGSGSFAGIPASYTVGSWDPQPNAALFSSGGNDFSESAHSSDVESGSGRRPAFRNGKQREVVDIFSDSEYEGESGRERSSGDGLTEVWTRR